MKRKFDVDPIELFPQEFDVDPIESFLEAYFRSGENIQKVHTQKTKLCLQQKQGKKNQALYNFNFFPALRNKLSNFG